MIRGGLWNLGDWVFFFALTQLSMEHSSLSSICWHMFFAVLIQDSGVLWVQGQTYDIHSWEICCYPSLGTDSPVKMFSLPLYLCPCFSLPGMPSPFFLFMIPHSSRSSYSISSGVDPLMPGWGTVCSGVPRYWEPPHGARAMWAAATFTCNFVLRSVAGCEAGSAQRRG